MRGGEWNHVPPSTPSFWTGDSSADFVGVQGPIFASSRAVILGAPGAFLLDRSSGPFSFRRRSRHGPSGPRRKCGVRRREPLCGATGVYQIKGAPAALCAVGNKREWGAGSTSPWEGKKRGLWGAKSGLAALCAEPPSPAGETFVLRPVAAPRVPARGGNPPSPRRARSPFVCLAAKTEKKRPWGAFFIVPSAGAGLLSPSWSRPFRRRRRGRRC